MTSVLKVDRLTKMYGSKQALDGISFEVKEGSCFGLLGPNGAGKSTTMKIITSILEPTSGSAEVLGYDIRKQSAAIRQQVGYVPQEITLHNKLTAEQNLAFFGEMYGVKGATLKERIRVVLEQVGLADRGKDMVGSFSGGMKRRINIAAALLHRPKLVILDEPTVGIDPQSRNHIFEMVRELCREGVTLIYSTHYMEEVETLCDDIAIIDHGRVVVQGALDELLERYTTKAVYVEGIGLDGAPEAEEIKSVVQEGKGWRLETDEPLRVMKAVSERYEKTRATITALEMMRPSLESVFLSMTGTSLRD
ncbi:ABC transporter ATP-binding protein [Paenibacillus kobensis]|uniref:ABC transporter ATP-binding protein n=1 Tax=Paenibacillus kobensis TaxID=59841 RepID=UPI000FDC3D8B|nr:ABC transporter ATP-binding protein [Paenibacillus kobensis]